MQKHVSFNPLQPKLASLKLPLIFVSGIVGLFYFPMWLGSILGSFKSDPTFSCLVMAAAGLGGHRVWRDRTQLSLLSPSALAYYIGFILIGCGLGASVYNLNSISWRALGWGLVLIGTALICWGFDVFKRFRIETGLILMSVHPGLNVLISSLWAHFWGYPTEAFTAWSSSLILKGLGHNVEVVGNTLRLIHTDVMIGYACSAFDSGLTLATTGLLVGIYLHQSSARILKTVPLGIAMAFGLNAVRLALLAIIANQGNDNMFDFWHGGLGSQIYPLLLFTLYSVVILSLPEKSPKG
jgi:exosortase/archaeosortase family protein